MSLFLQFAEVCDALAATAKKLEKRALIASYFQSLPVEDAGRPPTLTLAGVEAALDAIAQERGPARSGSRSR